MSRTKRALEVKWKTFFPLSKVFFFKLKNILIDYTEYKEYTLKKKCKWLTVRATTFGFKKSSFRWVLKSCILRGFYSQKKQCRSHVNHMLHISFHHEKFLSEKNVVSFKQLLLYKNCCSPGVFKTQSFSHSLFSQKSSIVEVRLGSKYVSDPRLLKFLLIPKQWLN